LTNKWKTRRNRMQEINANVNVKEEERTRRKKRGNPTSVLEAKERKICFSILKAATTELERNIHESKYIDSTKKEIFLADLALYCSAAIMAEKGSVEKAVLYYEYAISLCKDLMEKEGYNICIFFMCILRILRISRIFMRIFRIFSNT
jgi:hypothetical protein